MIKMIHVDAFASEPFKGNPTDVCFMKEFSEDQFLQAIAAENCLHETAFIVPRSENEYDLRWFTPGCELNLCGHATLAAGYCVFEFLKPNEQTVKFHSKSGILTVGKKGNRYEMIFPAYKLKKIPVTPLMEKAFGIRPVEAYLDRDLLCILPHGEDVRNARPDMKLMKQLPGLMQNITARSDDPSYDCVSRCFAPKLDTGEDSATGSAHCQIVPYWAGKLGKKKITALQASARTGVIYGEDLGDQVSITGEAALYAVGEIRAAAGR